MKMIQTFILLISFGCTFGSNEKLTSLKPHNARDTTFATVLQIGSAYSYALNKDSIVGLLLYNIRKEEDTVYYSFFISGKVFKEVPGKNELESAGVWGRKIPYGNSTQYMISFNSFSITEKDLRPWLGNFSFIEKVNLSQRNIVGSSGYIKSMNEIGTDLFILATKKHVGGNYSSILPDYPNEVFTFGNLLQTENPAEMVQPSVVWRLNKRTANPRAVQLMKEDWYWSEADDLSPFGSDEGSDAFYAFKDWREKNTEVEPALFLGELEKTWGVSFSHKDITSEVELREAEKKYQFLHTMDAGIIAVALGQFALEGRISDRLKDLGIKAVIRSLSPSYLADFDIDNRKEYERRLQAIKKIFQGA